MTSRVAPPSVPALRTEPLGQNPRPMRIAGHVEIKEDDEPQPQRRQRQPAPPATGEPAPARARGDQPRHQRRAGEQARVGVHRVADDQPGRQQQERSPQDKPGAPPPRFAVERRRRQQRQRQQVADVARVAQPRGDVAAPVGQIGPDPDLRRPPGAHGVLEEHPQRRRQADRDPAPGQPIQRAPPRQKLHAGPQRHGQPRHLPRALQRQRRTGRPRRRDPMPGRPGQHGQPQAA